jgi:predicted O-methyltransferase YrrM
MLYDLRGKDGIRTITDSPFTAEENALVERVKGIESLITPLEAVGLFRLCRCLPDNSKILEIGSYQGGSTTAIGRAIAGTSSTLYCLDVWSAYSSQIDFYDYDPSLIADDLRILSNFITNTQPYAQQINMMRGSSLAFAQMLKGQDFDLVFIDGAHDYRSVVFDITLALSALKPGGVLCGHDYQLDGERVKKAVDQLIGFVPTITHKGILQDTSIWCGIIEDPLYQHAKADAVRYCSEGDISSAVQCALDAYTTYRNDETLNLLTAIKSLST